MTYKFISKYDVDVNANMIWDVKTPPCKPYCLFAKSLGQYFICTVLYCIMASRTLGIFGRKEGRFNLQDWSIKLEHVIIHTWIGWSQNMDFLFLKAPIVCTFLFYKVASRLKIENIGIWSIWRWTCFCNSVLHTIA